MTKQESLRILDECIEYLDSLSDDEIDKLANEANEYMAKSFEETQQEKGNHQSITEVIDDLPWGFLDTSDIEPYRNTIIESLTKQTPQKVTHEATLIRETTCPRCKNVVGSYIDFNGVKTKVQYQYCSICGQALDWSDENEV